MENKKEESDSDSNGLYFLIPYFVMVQFELYLPQRIRGMRVCAEPSLRTMFLIFPAVIF